MLDIAVLNDICALINNWFDGGEGYWGLVTVEDGKISEALPLPKDCYVRITGSRSNDGAYLFNGGGLTDEIFTGTVSVMYMPKNFVKLVSDIAEWSKANEKALNGVYQSESFEGYSYNLGAAAGGREAALRSTFGSKLNRYRKI